MDKPEKYLRATVGAFIQNKEGKILLIRSPKWKDNIWVCPSGGIEYGEDPIDAAIRETKEEVGLDVKNPEFIQMVNMVEPELYHKPMHFIGLDYKFDLADEKQQLHVDPREVSEAEWFTLEEIVKRDDIESTTKDTVAKMLDMIKGNKRHGILHKKCKNCETCEKDMNEYKAGWMRAQADYKNLQGEVSKQRGEWARMSEQQILEEFIPVYDNFKKAFHDTNMRMDANDANNANVKQFENWKKGIEYIMKQYWKILEDHGVVEIRTVGELFNPEMHEAVGHEDSDESEGRILREVDGGYEMKGKVIKVAKVVVAK